MTLLLESKPTMVVFHFIFLSEARGGPSREPTVVYLFDLSINQSISLSIYLSIYLSTTLSCM